MVEEINFCNRMGVKNVYNQITPYSDSEFDKFADYWKFIKRRRKLIMMNSDLSMVTNKEMIDELKNRGSIVDLEIMYVLSDDEKKDLSTVVCFEGDCAQLFSKKSVNVISD